MQQAGVAQAWPATRFIGLFAGGKYNTKKTRLKAAAPAKRQNTRGSTLTFIESNLDQRGFTRMVQTCLDCDLVARFANEASINNNGLKRGHDCP